MAIMEMTPLPQHVEQEGIEYIHGKSSFMWKTWKLEENLL
jgi:hypothetical protein